MYEDAKDRNLIIVDEDSAAGSVVRWAPTVIVLGVVAGFISLAWYAYHAGTQSLKDEDLLVVEADKTPMKEKPLDPGGMKFPNQDKTIFETFAGNAQQPPKVERVVPAPEEPMPRDGDSGETKTWINDKLQKGADRQPEQVIGKEPPPASDMEMAPVAEAAPVVEKPQGDDEENTTTYVAKEAAPPVKTLDKMVKSQDEPKEASPAQGSAKVHSKPVAPGVSIVKALPSTKVPAVIPATAVPAQAQLGAYRSEEEAKAAWAKMAKKQTVLSGKSPLVVKADLGSRGVYYRLRVGGFGSADAAAAFCAKLTAGGQPCIVSSGK